MALENGNTISNFNSNWPLGQDFGNQGDDHIRLIKSILRTQFPGAAGNGFDIPITASEVELNFSEGLSDNTQDQLNGLSDRISVIESQSFVPSGTRMLFYQASVPVGWTQDVSVDDAMLRVVSGAGGGVGGSDSPISWTHAHNGGNHALTINEMPAHQHDGGPEIMLSESPGDLSIAVGSGMTRGRIALQGGGQAHNHGSTSSTDFNPRYADIIIGIKD